MARVDRADGEGESLQDLIRKRQAMGFVGREAQLTWYAENLGYPVNDPRRRFVFSVHGDGGVGKTLLMRQWQRIAQEQGAFVAGVDESVYSAPEAMIELATQLAAQGLRMKEFLRAAENYRQRRSEVEADPKAPTGIASLMTRTATRVGVEALRTVLPGVGGLAAAVDGDVLADQADQMRRFLGAKLRHEDVRMLLSPVDALTPLFVHELAAGGREREIALFLDAYERTGPFLEDWLLAIFEGKYGRLPARFVVSIAGRDPLNRSGWSPYLGVLADVPLMPFDETEARRLLSGRGVTDERVIEVILRLTGGLPLLVAMLAEQQPTDAAAIGDPTDGAVERFLKWESDPARRALAVTAALPRNVNEDVLRELITSDADARREFDWLRSLSFVTSHAGRCQYHAVVRSAMLRLEHGQSPSRWVESHRRLGAYYRALREESGTTDWRSDERLRELRLEECYHELCTGSAGAVQALLDSVVQVLDEGPEAAAAFIEAARQAAEDAGSARARDWAARLDKARRIDEGQGIAVLDLLLRDAELDRPVKAEGYRLRGRGHRLRQAYPQALDDFTHALELDPDNARALAGRGEALRLTERYEEALADFDRSIALDPDDVWTLGSRGLLRHALGHFEEALADFKRALELDPGSRWMRHERVVVYLILQRHEEALADLDRSLERDCDDGWAVAVRGDVLRRIGRFDQALAEFTRAVELGAEYAWLMESRGQANRELGQHEQALADFTRAIELDPDDAWAAAGRGQILQLLGRYEESVVDPSRSLAVRSDCTWAINSRFRAYRSPGRDEEAFTDLTQALRREPDNTWLVARRSEMLLLAGRYDEALIDVTRLREFKPAEPWYLYLLGLVRRVRGELDEAAELLVRAARGFDQRAAGTGIKAVRNLGNLIVCRCAQGDFEGARRLVIGFANCLPNVGQLNEVRQDLAHLSGIPGGDPDAVLELAGRLGEACATSD